MMINLNDSKELVSFQISLHVIFWHNNIPDMDQNLGPCMEFEILLSVNRYFDRVLKFGTGEGLSEVMKDGVNNLI